MNRASSAPALLLVLGRQLRDDGEGGGDQVGLDAARADDAQHRVLGAGLVQRELGELLEAVRQGDLEAGGGVRQPDEVRAEPEWTATVDAHGLECRLATEQGEVER